MHTEHQRYKSRFFQAASSAVETFSNLGSLFIELRTDGYISQYEENLFKRILPLKTLTKSKGIILYWVDKRTKTIKRKQSDINSHCEDINIPISPHGHVAGVTAYNKGEYLIQDVQNFSRRYESMIIDRDRQKNSILFHPISSSKGEVLAVIELFRNDQLVYTTDDCQYVAAILKWVGLALEQANDALKQKNEQNINTFLKTLLDNYLSRKITFLTYIHTAFKMMKDSLNAEFFFYYNINETENNNLNIKIFAEEHDTTMLNKILEKTIKINPNSEKYSDQVFTKHQIINKMIEENDPNLDTDVLSFFAGESVESIIYLPFSFKDKINAMAVFINPKAKDDFKRSQCSEQQIMLLKKICYFMAPGFHLRRTFKKRCHESNEYEKYKEVLLSSLLLKSHISDYFSEVNEVGTNFNSFEFTADKKSNILGLSYYMFLRSTNFFEKNTLKTFILVTKKAHLEKKFHNFELSFIYLHTIYVMLVKIVKEHNHILEDIEKAALLTTCILFGVQNLGLTDAILYKIRHPIWYLYRENCQRKFSLDIAKFIIQQTELIGHHSEDVQAKFMQIIEDLFHNYMRALKGYLNERFDKILDNMELNFVENKEHRLLVLTLILYCTQKSRSFQSPKVAALLNKKLIEERNIIQCEILNESSLTSNLVRFNRSNIEYIERYEIPKLLNNGLTHFKHLVCIFPCLNEIITLSEQYHSDLNFQLQLVGKKVWIPDESRGIFSNPHQNDVSEISVTDNEDKDDD